VKIPADVALGAYYLLACADDEQAVTESAENSNCIASAATLQVTAPDLVVSALAPPRTAPVGAAVSVTHTVENRGDALAGASTTHHYLSADQTFSATDLRLATVLAASFAPAETAVVTTPATVPPMNPGPYYVITCVDITDVVIESVEENNCLVSTATVAVTAPDLAAASVGNPPATVALAASFTVADTVENRGTATAAASTTRYYLSVDTTRSSTDWRLTGSRSVPSLTPGVPSAGTATVTAAAAPPGSYFLLACADDLAVVFEGDEQNNCAASSSTVLLAAADLVVSALTDPPVAVNVGSNFANTNTVLNAGNVSAGTSTLRFYLSLNTTYESGDRPLSATRSIPGLAAGATSTATITVGVPSMTLGTYYLLACADDTRLVPEGDETNNCRASSTPAHVRGVDLIVQALSQPPATVTLAGSFPLTETVANAGDGTAGSSTTRYYLSTDPVFQSSDKRMSVTRIVPVLAGGTVSEGTVTVVVSGVTVGNYFVIACADDVKTVPEIVETNNCRASATLVQVTAPDLIIAGLSDPPAAAALASTFVSTETLRNNGNGAAGTSTTRYYLSVDTAYSSSDKRLTATRVVTGLAAGIESISPVTLAVPSMALGSYHLLACADDTRTVTESNETNNCRAAVTPVLVTAPDLVVTVVTDPPLTLALGGTFSVTDSVANNGDGASGTSTTRYYLSLDAAYSSTDRRLTATRVAPGLLPAETSTGTVTLTVPTSTVPGTYFVLACADDLKTVVEGNETNNCRASAAKVSVGQ
jgi:subtilase family serine protease